MKHLVFTLALLITAPAITCSANYRVYSFNLDSLVTVEIVVFDSLLPDTNVFRGKSYFQGVKEGKWAYDRTGASTATGIVTFLFVPAGLLVAISLSTSPPLPGNFVSQQHFEGKSPSYLVGFQKGLNKAKSKSVWNGFLKGWGAALFLGLIFIAATS